MNYLFYIDDKPRVAKLLHRGSSMGLSKSSWFNTQVNTGGTLIIARSEDARKVFGGFTDLPFKDHGGYRKANTNNGFLFSIRDDKSLVTLKYIGEPEDEICMRVDGGIGFGNGGLLGGGLFLRDANDCGSNDVLGNAYEAPVGI